MTDRALSQHPKTPERRATAAASCVVCGATDISMARADLADLEYSVVPQRSLAAWACASCCSQFLLPRPTDAELDGYYPDDYHCYNEDHGRIARRLVGMRASRRAREYRSMLGGYPGRLFDVGAGDCRHFDEVCRGIDLECAGVELNAEMAAAARARGYDVRDGTLEALDISDLAGTFDIVSMNHVLEHVVDPADVVARCFALLRPGGHIVGQLPCVNSWEARLFGRSWGGYHFPRHLQMFSSNGLATLLADTGFTDVHVRSALHIQTALSLQNSLIRAGWRPTMRYGKSPAYSACLVAAVPFEVLAFAFGRGGIMNFAAQRPVDAPAVPAE